MSSKHSYTYCAECGRILDGGTWLGLHRRCELALDEERTQIFDTLEGIEKRMQQRQLEPIDSDRHHFDNENDRAVWDELGFTYELTRDELVQLTGIPRTTVYDALKRMLIKGWVKRISEVRKTKGRPNIFWKKAG